MHYVILNSLVHGAVAINLAISIPVSCTKLQCLKLNYWDGGTIGLGMMLLEGVNNMIKLDEFKNSLENLKNELSEEEILKLRENQDRMAEIFFNSWLTKISNK